MSADGTLQYYAEHAEAFAAGTLHANVSPLYVRFEALLPDGARILDLGCGSGRDSLYFIKRGYRVEAVDGSPELCAIAEKTIGQPVRCLLFADLDYAEAFDGIWACASLLHVPAAKMADVLQKVAAALKPGGILYASYKYGDTQRKKDGRLYSDYNEDTMAALLRRVPELRPEEMWLSEDVRRDRAEAWLNVIVRKGR